MGRRQSILSASLLVAACVLAGPLQAQDNPLAPPPADPNQPSLFELLQRVLTQPGEGAQESANPWMTPRGVTIQPRPAAKATPAEAGAVAPAPAAPSPTPSQAAPAPGEETVAQPLAGPQFEEQPLAPLAPVPAASTSTAPAPAAAQANTAASAAVSTTPRLRQERQGYAFSHPRILAQQTLFGLAHGIALLARACAVEPDSAAVAQDAYQAWEARNQLRIAAAENELARYYFTPPHDQVRRLDLVQALQLKSDLGLATDGPELKAACATLPEALAKPRYDLELQWLLKGDGERLRRATETRELVSQCRQQAEGEAVEQLDASLSRWDQANAGTETEARQRLVAEMSSLPDPKHPDRPADGETMMKNWQDELRRIVGRRLAYGAAEVCPGLAEALATPAYDLAHAFDAE